MYQNIGLRIHRTLPNILIDAAVIGYKFKVHVYIEDNHPTIIKLMYKNVHGHEQRNTKTGTASPVLELVSKYVECNLTNTQISHLLSVNYPTASMATN